MSIGEIFSCFLSSSTHKIDNLLFINQPILVTRQQDHLVLELPPESFKEEINFSQKLGGEGKEYKVVKVGLKLIIWRCKDLKV